MKKDVELLHSFRADAAKHLAEELQISFEEADQMIRFLESEDMLKFEAPEYADRPAEILTEDRQLLDCELGMTSHKAGNVILNTHLDWRTTAVTAASAIETFYGADLNNPVLLVTGIVSLLLTLSVLTDIKIEEQGTAIIMALQQYKRHQVFTALEEECRQKANEILVSHGYDEMDRSTFQKEITKLQKIRCVNLSGDRIQLIEKVIMHY